MRTARGDECTAAVIRRRLAWISVLGVVSVGTLVATGIVNTWFLGSATPSIPLGRMMPCQWIEFASSNLLVT